ANSAAAAKVVEEKASGYNILGDPRPAVMEYVANHKINEGTYPSLAVLIQDIDKEVKQLRVDCKNPGRCGRQYPQRHVSRRRGSAQSDEGQGQRSVERRSGESECVQA